MRLVGRFTEHPKHGETFVATFYEQVTPTTPAGLSAFLASDSFDLDPLQAAAVVATFGLDTPRVIEREPERLREAGLSVEEAERVHEDWAAGQALARLVRLVEPTGLPMAVVHAIHARWGGDADAVARETPYRLLDVEGVGFAHADALAMHLGVDPLDPERLAAGALSAVRAARRADGHQCLPRPQVVEQAARLLGVDRVAASAGIDHAESSRALVVDRDVLVGDAPAVYTEAGHRAERELAGALVALGSAIGRVDVPLPSLDPELTAGQQEAVTAAFVNPVSIITGGPGTGKTRTIGEIVTAATGAGLHVGLCAPTGRAAKRLEEMVGHAATTIHRLLEARPLPGGGFAFTRNAESPLPHELVVVDEVSMCDTALARSLVTALEPTSRLVLVGDADQLPSVGPGDVLRDLVASGAIPVTRLTEIHRQAEGSRVVALARAINAGDVAGAFALDTEGRGWVDGDVYIAEERRSVAIAPRVVEAVASRAPERFGVASDEVQVVAPMYRGKAGVDALNEALRERLNPPAGQPDLRGFREGDRVLQTRNDAELDVANGDIGTVVDVAAARRTLRVAFPRGEVTYDAEQARALTWAWAVTVHKSQGGEWPVVVLVCDSAHRRMLSRQLLYTAVTRAQQALIVVGQSALLDRGARINGASARWTGLRQRLSG
ncbi:MAG: AAA family ATPase [Nitriliruptorales bacterium]|nr:AAA family ATPase [Nitriliruptorales bacterium]